jgi:mannose-6-phosphate isomerase-like protein (cupin superfamily)
MSPNGCHGQASLGPSREGRKPLLADVLFLERRTVEGVPHREVALGEFSTLGEDVVIPVINLEEQANAIQQPWSPVDVARVNDQVLRLAMIQDEYHWHRHTNEDELFYVLKGCIIIRVKGHPDVVLNEGEMAVIPRGVEHCPTSAGVSYILMFEPFELQSRGD